MARNSGISFADAMRVVEDLVREIRNHRHGVQVAEILKAGSLGQQTAVLGNFDVDLVVYSNSVNPRTVLEKGYERPIQQLRSHMGREWRASLKRPPSQVSVNMRYETTDLEIDCDILVSPNWDCKEDLYNFLTTAKREGAEPAQLFRFSVNASKWQVEFILNQDEKARELIRRAKAWRDGEWPEGERRIGRPKSYLISLLVVKAYEVAKQMPYLGGTIEQRTTDKLIEIVKDHLNANIYWEEYYERGDYPHLFPTQCPRIVDPANPANNLHETGIIGGSSYSSYTYELGDGNWTEMVRKIDSIDLTRTVEQIQADYQ